MIRSAAHFIDELPHREQRRPIITVGKMFARHPRLDLGVEQPGIHPTTLRGTARGLQDQAGADPIEPHINRMAQPHRWRMRFNAPLAF